MIEAVYASTWQSSFRILPDRYRHDGFKHPVLHDAARFLIDDPPSSSSSSSFSSPEHSHPAGRVASVDAYWNGLADAVGAATVGVSMRKVRTVDNVVREEKELAQRRRTSRDRGGVVKASASVGTPGTPGERTNGRDATRRDDGVEDENDPQRRLEQEVAEDEFTATVMLYCAAAKGGRLVGALLAAAWGKLGGLEGVKRERAEWVHFQLDVWSVPFPSPPSSHRAL